MKKVEAMKKAIVVSRNNAYKWTAKADGLHWGYLDTVFTLSIYKESENGTIVSFEDQQTGCRAYTVLVPEADAWLVDEYHDFAITAEDAIQWAAEKMIRKAERCY